MRGKRGAIGKKRVAKGTLVPAIEGDWSRRLEDIADAAPGAIVSFLLRPDGTACFPFASKAIEDIYGYSRSVLAKDAWVLNSIIHPMDAPILVEAIAASAKTLQRWHAEFRIRHPVKGDRFIEATSSPERLADGSTLWHGFVMDVTEKRLAQDALRESERKFASIAGSLRGFAYRCANEPDWPLEYVSDGIVDIVGVPAEDFTSGRSAFGQLIVPRDRDRVWNGVQAAIAARRPYVLEYRVSHVNGDERWVWERGAGVFDGETLVALEGFITDITDRRRAELALQESDARMRLAATSANVGLWDWDLQTNRVFFSKEWKSQLGYAEHEITDDFAEWQSRVHPDDLERFLNTVRTYLANPWPDYHLEFRLRHKDGSYRAILAQASLITDSIGKPVRMLGSHIDLTERKKAEETIRQSEQRLQMALSAGRVGLWTWDLRTNKIDVSPEWKRHIGEANVELTNEEWASRIHPDDRERSLGVVRDYLASDAPDFEMDFRFRQRDGSYRNVLARGSSERDESGNRIRLLGSQVDITERVELEAQLRQAQKMESVGRLAGGIAHDFNNLLTVIGGTADMALAGLPPSDPLRADLQQIRFAGDRAASLTRQLLAFSRKQIMRQDVIDLNSVMSASEQILRRLIGEDVKLVLVPEANIGRVLADTVQIEQIILNLAVNARDAMAQGGTLTIETRNVDLDAGFAAEHRPAQPGPHVELSFRDTGAGMDPATVARIFEPFFTTKEPGKGTGLGLSTVYGIVKQSGGTIWVDSLPGHGTTFRIYLPRVDAIVPVNAAEHEAAPDRGTETILVVEDEVPLRRLAERVLGSAGYTVLTAGNGDEALDLMAHHSGPVHLVLTDVVMPGMSGRELVARLAMTRAGLKYLYTSGYTDDDVVRRGVLAEGAHFLAKPYSRSDLTRRVREVLQT